MGVPGPRLRSGFGTGCSCKVNKQPSRDGAALIWVGIVAGGTAVSAMAAQGWVWEWVEGKKKKENEDTGWVASPRQIAFAAVGGREMGRGHVGVPQRNPLVLQAFTGSTRRRGDPEHALGFCPQKEALNPCRKDLNPTQVGRSYPAQLWLGL